MREIEREKKEEKSKWPSSLVEQDNKLPKKVLKN